MMPTVVATGGTAATTDRLGVALDSHDCPRTGHDPHRARGL